MEKIDLEFFEKVIIFNCLKDSSYLGCILDHIKTDYFNNKKISNILQIIKDFYISTNTVPNLTEIKTRLHTKELKNDYIEVVNSFKTLDTVYNKEELLRNTEYFLKQKAVYCAVINSAEDFGKGDVDSDTTLKRFEEACNISLMNDFGLDIINNVDDFIYEINKPNCFISTGYEWMDKIFKGFLTKGKALYVVSATTNVGKSIMLTNLACNVAKQNKKVVIFTLEMSEEMYGKRVSSCLVDIGLDVLTDKSDDFKNRIVALRKQYSDANIIIKEFPTKSASTSHLRAFLKKLYDIKKIKPDLIVVDYINLMRPRVTTGSSYEDIKSISEELRGLSYEMNGTPILSATQLNREAANEENPGLETTSESFGLPMTADVQLSLWASEMDKENGHLHAGMQKNRFGKNFGKTTYQIDWDTLIVREIKDSVLSNKDLNSTKSILDSLK